MITETILALDQSISCSGVVIMRDGEVIYFECIKTSKDDGTNTRRISYITARIMKLYDQYDCDYMTCEALSLGSIGSATRDLASLLGALEVKMFEKYGFDEIPKVAPTSLKKFATGSGRAKKPEMLEVVPDGIVEDFFSAGYLKSKGGYDLVDAYHIGKWWFVTHSENKTTKEGRTPDDPQDSVGFSQRHPE